MWRIPVDSNIIEKKFCVESLIDYFLLVQMLKYAAKMDVFLSVFAVAPRVGARIEILHLPEEFENKKSPLV